MPKDPVEYTPAMQRVQPGMSDEQRRLREQRKADRDAAEAERLRQLQELDRTLPCPHPGCTFRAMPLAFGVRSHSRLEQHIARVHHDEQALIHSLKLCVRLLWKLSQSAAWLAALELRPEQTLMRRANQAADLQLWLDNRMPAHAS